MPNQLQPPENLSNHGILESLVLELKLHQKNDLVPLTDLTPQLAVLDRLLRLHRVFDQLAPRESGAYKLTHVRRLLENPIAHDLRVLSPETDDLLNHKRLGINRKNVNQPDSEKVYAGKWYFQGEDGTCVAWSIANSFAIQGKKIGPKALLGLMNAAIHDGKDQKHGLGYELASTILQLDSDFSLGLSISKERLVSTRYLAPTVADFDTYSRQIDSIYQQFDLGEDLITALSCYFDKKSKSALLQAAHEQNAREIKKSLDAGQPLIVTVIPEFFHGDQCERLSDTCLHSIVIAGYYLHNGVMDLQIVDSSNGIYWASLEQLSSSLLKSPETVEASSMAIDFFAKDLLWNQKLPRRELLKLIQDDFFVQSN